MPEPIALECEHCGLESARVKRRMTSPYTPLEERTALCPDCWQDVVDLYDRSRLQP